ncbi:MAG TPA: chromosomal replication initiator protein DnaA [Gemmatimonadota bacterium]|nr:chromosomal replication initiator protein DnaA [Gemmatimonadota bacterium]
MHSAELTAPEVWSLILAETKKVVSSHTFSTWLEPTEALALSQDQLLVVAKNQFAADYIDGQYGETLASIAESLFGNELAIAFQSAAPDESPETPDRGVPSDDIARPAGPVAPGERGRLAGNRPAYLGLPLNERYVFDTFVVGNSNQYAHAASIAVAERPGQAFNPLFIYGGVGLGKTHLMQAIGHEILSSAKLGRVCYMSAETFMNQMIEALQFGKTLEFRNKYRRVDLLLIDDVQFLQGKDATQEEFFHTFNALYDAHKQIILTSDRQAKEIPTLEERLVSRFEWGLVVDIKPPDLETRIAILQHKAGRNSLELPQEVLLFIASNVKSNVRELEGSLVRLIAASSLNGLDITIELAEEVLKNILTTEIRRVTVDRIQHEVASEYDVTIEGLKSRRRTRTLTVPRQVGMYLCRQLTDLPLVEIGQAFGGRDHTTVIHACDKVEHEIQDDRGIRMRIDALRDRIAS